MNWYYSNGDKAVGPLAGATMVELRSCGMLIADTQVLKEGTDVWVRFDDAFRKEVKLPDAPIIKFHCPNCNARISVESEFAGRDATCPTCGQGMVVPVLPQMAPRVAGVPHHASPEDGQGRNKSNNTMKTFMKTVVGVVIMGCVVLGMIYSHGGRRSTNANGTGSESKVAAKPANVSSSGKEEDISTSSSDKGIAATPSQPERQHGNSTNVRKDGMLSNVRRILAQRYSEDAGLRNEIERGVMSLYKIYPDMSAVQLVRKFEVIATGG